MGSLRLLASPSRDRGFGEPGAGGPEERRRISRPRPAVGGSLRLPAWLKREDFRTRSAWLPTVQARRQAPRPVRVRIRQIGVDARVVPVGVGHRKMVEIPERVSTVGWYRFGPSPGSPGSALLIGHVDSRIQGAGAFFRLRELEPGHRMVVSFSDGARATFEVVARRSYPKDRLPPALYERHGRPRLALVTCGGFFDEATRHYSDNVVVYAVPVSIR